MLYGSGLGAAFARNLRVLYEGGIMLDLDPTENKDRWEAAARGYMRGEARMRPERLDNNLDKLTSDACLPCEALDPPAQAGHGGDPDAKRARPERRKKMWQETLKDLADCVRRLP